MMKTLVVVDQASDWSSSNVDAMSAADYLRGSPELSRRDWRVLNLCRSYRYQSTGYYVSLLAAARGHRITPDVGVILDFRQAMLPRWLSDELDELIQKSLKDVQSNQFVLSVYFGENLAARHASLARRLFNLVPAPLVRAHFERPADSPWRLMRLRPIALNDVPDSHLEFMHQAADRHFRRPNSARRKKPAAFNVAILVNREEKDCPSDEAALVKFERAFERASLAAERISREDAGRIAEFDGLFIRETTAVNHHTYRIARHAAREGLVVIDDPDSIMRCANKVFLAELLASRGIATPRTMIIHRGDEEAVIRELGLPVVIKLPDSAFSLGVVKVHTPAELKDALTRYFRRSDLLVAQAYTRTEFDWRVGVIDGEPLYACRYFMAKEHWQIIDRDGAGDAIFGSADTLALEETPPQIIDCAVAASNAIGKGLYGVDIKEVDGKAMVIEVNDNPNIDEGVEDLVAGDQLYDRVVAVFVDRLRSRTGDKR